MHRAAPLLAAFAGTVVVLTSGCGGRSSGSNGTINAAAAVPGDPCSSVAFSQPLGPVNPPADVHQYSAPPSVTIDPSRLYVATINTDRGPITLCLQPHLSPVTVNNFVTLARNHFYDRLSFHRVVPGFIAQGGDPREDGSGGPGYQFDDEPVRTGYDQGSVAMANAGPNTNGSQFFICLGAPSTCTTLPPSYNMVGHVTSGQPVAEGLHAGDVITSVVVRQQT